MMRTTMRTLAIAALAVALVGMTAGAAMAQRRGGGGRGVGGGYRGGGGEGYRGGYRGGWGGYGGGIYFGLGSPYYGGYYGGYGSPYYYGSTGDYYPNGIYLDTAPTYQSGYYAPPSSVVPSGYETTQNDMTATLSVHVPPNAKVWVDGDPTQQTGENRLYSSPPLTADKEFHYTIRAQWNDNGKVVDQTRRVPVRAGQTTTVDFMQPAPKSESPK